jgi:hypothetical protein
MNTIHKTALGLLFFSTLAILFSVEALDERQAHAQTPSPTPTTDPLAQPPLPSNPTELELGRYLYWRHCMPCHGDHGQGLTDEFRGLWVPDHQNCWARGCHSGKYASDSFPVPTYIPAVVEDDGLAHFESQQSLVAYLKATHPPQDPGFLEGEEYRQIALFVFWMNNRLPEETAAPPSPTPTPRLSLPKQDTARPYLMLSLATGLAVFILAIFWLRRFANKGK